MLDKHINNPKIFTLLRVKQMYNHSSAKRLLDFALPFSGKQLADNRWEN